MQTASGVLCAELVRDFLEFYKLDYTLSIFLPEAGLKQSQLVMNKEDIQNKIGLEGDASKPMMMQLLESFISNERPAANDKSVDKSLEKPQEKPKKEEPKVEQPAKKELQETTYKSAQ